MRLKDNTGKKTNHLNNKQRKKKRKEKWLAGKRKNSKLKRRIFYKNYQIPLDVVYQNERRTFITKFYKPKKYKDPLEVVDIKGEFGLENNIDHFINLANSFMSFKSKELFFDLKECKKMWPSAITLLCSLKQWVELTSKPGNSPKIGSTPSDNEKVNSYLDKCGFYDYVQRDKDIAPNYYDKDVIVRIERETDTYGTYKKEDDIVALLKKYSIFNNDEIELFDNIVLTEIFNNVTEHGINKTDKGWWTLSQYHKSTRIISICIADNGIGIKNNLITGPQGVDIKNRINIDEDGKFLELAIKENISGAIGASQKTGMFIKKYDRGSRRGHGLKRVTSACAKLDIPFVILSHDGYIAIEGNGKISKLGSKGSKIFAGTLFYFTIPAK